MFRNVDGVVQKVFPYIHGRIQDGQLVDGAIEYPVLTGIIMWFTALFTETPDGWVKVSAIFFAPLGLVTAFLLVKMAGWRALMWCAAPALILYALHNWDLPVVAASVAGLWFWSRGSPMWAAVMFGLGAALKMYPIFFLGPLFLDGWFKNERDRALQSLMVGVGVFLALNLPFMIANFDGWYATYEFHRARGPNFDSLWYVWQPTWTPDQVNFWSAVLTAGFFLGALIYGWIRGKREGAYPFIAVCGSLLATFLLWNKVHSPQYTLWLLPFFVLLRVNVLWWVAYSLADLAVYFGIFHFYGGDLAAESMWERGVWTRALLLLILSVVFLRSRPTVGGTAPVTRDAGETRSRFKEWLSEPLRAPSPVTPGAPPPPPRAPVPPPPP